MTGAKWPLDNEGETITFIIYNHDNSTVVCLNLPLDIFILHSDTCSFYLASYPYHLYACVFSKLCIIFTAISAIIYTCMHMPFRFRTLEDEYARTRHLYNPINLKVIIYFSHT